MRKDKRKEDGTMEKGKRGTCESGLFQPFRMLPETQRKECECGLFLGPALRFSLTLCASKHSSGRV